MIRHHGCVCQNANDQHHETYDRDSSLSEYRHHSSFFSPQPPPITYSLLIVVRDCLHVNKVLIIHRHFLGCCHLGYCLDLFDYLHHIYVTLHFHSMIYTAVNRTTLFRS
jgi:hypothetical protein